MILPHQGTPVGRNYSTARIKYSGTAVYPQGCGIIEGIVCGAAIAACLPLCLTNVTCWVGCLGISLFGFCRDCIPGI